MRHGARRRLLAGLLSSLMILSVTAAPAQAKSGISITVVPVDDAASPAAGRIAVSAFGGDDAAGRQRLCVQRLVGGAWRTVLCGHAELGSGGWVRAKVARTVHGKSLFRAVLQRITRNGRPRPIADLVSAPVSPLAASAAALAAVAPVAAAAAVAATVPGECAQPQTDSKSTVSLSSVDNGIETASVVRSK
jgi:hypothetical protein